MRTGSSVGALAAAGKLFTVIITTCAALAALMVNAQNLGLTSWLGASDIGFAGYAARRIIISPRADSLFAIGDTAILAATVTDRRGAVLIGAPLSWSSDDTAVVAVDTTGAVIARGPGLARVTVQVREHHASAVLVVRQRAARVILGGDSALSLPEADSTRLAASVVDARGHRIRGLGVTWASSDTFAVVVDSAGRLIARAPGRAMISARAAGVAADLPVEVQLTPFRLALEAGSSQHAPTGRPLPAPVQVQVLSRGGLPVPNADVAFFPEDGAVDVEHARTDAKGRARVTWTLGPRPGRQTLRSRLPGIDTAVTVVAEADPSPAHTRVELADTVLRGTVGATLNPPVILRVTDLNGLPLSDVPVGWTAFDGGSVLPLAPRTDSLGQVVARWTLGRRTGRQRIKAEVGDARSMPPLMIAATAVAAGPKSALVVSGDGQRNTVGKLLAKPIVLAVKDIFGNPVVGAPFTVHPAAGAVIDSTLESDEAGRVTFRWTLGEKPGTQRLTVRGPKGVPVTEVTAQASAAAPAPVTVTRKKPKKG